jgi:nucleoside-diphosphate-sugar epimerase
MKVLVTGGSGFLGSHVVEQLIADGRSVRALVRRTSDLSFLRTLPGLELADGSIEDAGSLRQAMQDVTHVVHSAGLVKARSADEFMRVNAGGTASLLKAALDAGSVQRFVFVSSLTVAGPSEQGKPVPLDRKPRPVTNYGRSKLAAEHAVLTEKDQLSVVILRPAAIYGPRDREVLVFFQSVKRRVLPMIAPPTSRVSMIYGADCAMACIAALSAQVPSGSVYYLDDGVIHTFDEMLREVENALGTRTLLSFPLPRRLVLGAALATELYGRATDRAVIFTRDKCNELFNEWICDGTQAMRELGFRPRYSFSEGVRLTAEWYKRAGWL